MCNVLGRWYILQGTARIQGSSGRVRQATEDHVCIEPCQWVPFLVSHVQVLWTMLRLWPGGQLLLWQGGSHSRRNLQWPIIIIHIMWPTDLCYVTYWFTSCDLLICTLNCIATEYPFLLWIQWLQQHRERIKERSMTDQKQTKMKQCVGVPMHQRTQWADEVKKEQFV